MSLGLREGWVLLYDGKTASTVNPEGLMGLKLFYA
jgi:hypothetical protein